MSDKIRTIYIYIYIYISGTQANMDVKKKKFLYLAYLAHLEKWEVDLTSGNYVPYDFLKIRVKSTVYSRFVISLPLTL